MNSYNDMELATLDSSKEVELQSEYAISVYKADSQSEFASVAYKAAENSENASVAYRA